MDENLETLNEKLDQLVVIFFEKVEALEDMRKDLTSAIRTGFLSMSKARYSMGNKAVSTMQYATNMTASTYILEKDNVSSEGPEFEVVFDGNKKRRETCKEVENLAENHSDGLRQRGAEKRYPQENEKSEIELSGRRKSTDALKWFGILVPTSLKDCQLEFKKACHLSCVVAQLEQKVNHILTDYKKLKEKKIIVQSRNIQNSISKNGKTKLL